jgi:hypothetical protein
MKSEVKGETVLVVITICPPLNDPNSVINEITSQVPCFRSLFWMSAHRIHASSMGTTSYHSHISLFYWPREAIHTRGIRPFQFRSFQFTQQVDRLMGI